MIINDKKEIDIITLLSFLAILISCNSSTNSNVNEDKSTIDNDKEQVDKTAIGSKTKMNQRQKFKHKLIQKRRDF